MKSFFSACLIAAVSTADLVCVDGYYKTTGYTGSTFCCNNNNYRDCYCEDGYSFDDFNFECDLDGGDDHEHKTPAQKFKDLFEKNEDGRWQLVDRKLDLPQLSFSDVDPAEIEEWYQGKMEISSEQGQKWADAWIAYQDAITQPWNDFVYRAEEFAVEGAELDMQTDEEIIRFIADNTFVDGVSLTDKYPQIDEWIAEMKEQADWEEFYDFEPLLKPVNDDATPVVLQSSYYDNETEEWVYEQSEWEKCKEEMRNKLVSYGYDTEVAKAWIESSGETWQELTQKQDKESMELGQQQIREASEYVKGIFDNVIADLRAQQVKNQEEFQSNVDSYVVELKQQIDQQSIDNINNFEEWFNQKYNDVVDITEVTYEEVHDDAWLMQASKSAATATESNAYYGYGILSMGAVLAGATYLYKKRQAKQVNIDNSALI